MAGRKYPAAGGLYRYGFNGKEKDDDVMQYDYGYRIYDPRLVRFKSVDPLSFDYPELTPYQFASNRPIEGADMDGLEFVKKTDDQGNTIWLFYKPQPASGYGTMSSKGMPVALVEKESNMTNIHTVTFKQSANNTFIAQSSLMQVQGKVKSEALKIGASQKLKNGASVSLNEFSTFENKDLSEGQGLKGVYTGLNINLTYTSTNKKVSGVYFLQSIGNPTGDERTYDASGEDSPSNPFYFPQFINKGIFKDMPSFSYDGKPGVKKTFNAELVIYEKTGDAYKAVGKLSYSYDVTFDKKGKGKVSNVKQKFTDLTKK